MNMRLSELVAALDAGGRPVSRVIAGTDAGADPDPLLVDAEHDSRQVTPGAIFACIRGDLTDGHDHAEAAVAAGAVAVLVEYPLDVTVPQVLVHDVRATIGPLAAEIHGRPTERLDLVGVTGTNGKTTTVRLISDVLTANGRTVAEIGTLTGTLTTPEATELQRQFAQAVDRGDDVVAIEVSSHALDQHRVDGSRFRVAAFTNLGRDHLDHHTTVEAYFAAKARLFEPELAEMAVIDVGSPHGRLLAETCTIPVVTIDSRETELVCVKPGASRFRWRGRSVVLPLGGTFNVANAVLAAEIANVLGVDEDDIVAALAQVEPVPGRFESIDEGQGFSVLVDYAHTPDGLEAVLEAARAVADGQIIVVFGAGGDRDREKRPRMGAAAAELADHVIVTSDNPRGEDPDTIIAAIIAGMSNAPELVEPNRRAAIRHAIGIAATGDVVVIAGKGHETTQTIADRVEEFDDRVIARDEIRRRAGGAG